MPRTESSSAESQGYLDFYYLSSAITFLGSGLGPQCKNGTGPQIIGPHSNQIKIFNNLEIIGEEDKYKKNYINFFFKF